MKNYPNGNAPDTYNLIAGPYTGKGTSTEYLVQEFDKLGMGAQAYSTGDRVRAKMQGLRAEYSDKGLMIPDHKIITEIHNGFDELDPELVWLLDGYPRTKGQIKPYTDIMTSLRRNDVIVFMLCTKETARKRWQNRVQQALAAGKEVRADDMSEEAFEKRMKDAEALPGIADELERNGREVVRMDANGSVEEVRGQLDDKVLSRHSKVEVLA
jgi:adenylate kinase family enzyme